MKEGGEKGLHRRDFMSRAAAAIAVGTAGGIVYLGTQHTAQTPKKDDEIKRLLDKKEEPKENPEAFLDVEKRPRTFQMGNVAGVTVSGLLAAYTVEQPRRVRPVEQIDFRYLQARLWKRKLQFVKEKRPGAYPALLNGAAKLFTSYNPDKITSMTFAQYQKEADLAISAIRKDTDIARIKNIPAFSDFKPDQVALLRHFEQHINGEALMAYALTELMPTGGKDSRTGSDVFDFLLRNAGREFVDRIPAVHDARLSVGAYQFTSDALYEVGSVRNGASRVQHAILKDPKKRHIPGSVLDLHGPAQHKAAYLFAIDNLAMSVRKLGNGRAKKLLAQMADISPDLVSEYIAAAHHKPVNARNALLAYIDEAIKFRALPDDKRTKAKIPDFLAHCQSTGVGEYCAKTRGNLSMLRARG